MPPAKLSLSEAMQKASAAYAAGDLAQVETLCKAILAAKPAHADANHLLAIVQSRTGRAEEALLGYERALALGPRSAMLLNNRGNILLALKRNEEALASYDAALALDPRNPETLINRAAALKALGREEEALAVCDAVIARKAGSASAHFNRGNVLRGL
jgi:tetratricopeptide (TPR) repeat protein